MGARPKSRSPAATAREPARLPDSREGTTTVALKVTVAADGSPKDVEVVRDPGHGFGDVAQRCALSRRWSPALDHEGSPVGGTVIVNVRFDR
jgi:periplasmic protein TonB